MFTRKNQRGLTLIEIIMSLAIAGLLAATVLTGRDQLRARLQFSQAMDQVTQILTTARSEASGTVGSTTLSSGGQSPNQFIFGKMVTFQSGNSDVKVSTITFTCPGGSPNCTSGTITSTNVDPYTVTIPWLVEPSGPASIAFGLDSNGHLQAYTGVGLTPITNPAASVPFDNGVGGRTGSVSIDSIGNVTRMINP